MNKIYAVANKGEGFLTRAHNNYTIAYFPQKYNVRLDARYPIIITWIKMVMKFLIPIVNPKRHTRMTLRIENTIGRVKPSVVTLVTRKFKTL